MQRLPGPVWLDLDGVELTPEERELLDHPAVGGVILFARNCAEPQQVRALTAAIRAAGVRPLPIAVDQEGGRVQRCRAGFTPLPAAARLGERYRQDPAAALAETADLAWLLASELRAVGIDFSFAPVLDLNHGKSAVIGDRAFAAEAHAVSELALAWQAGCAAAGMAACGKHFPGHGGVVEDSHHACPVDPRDLATLLAADLVPFAKLIKAGLTSVMPAHVVYPAVDERPAGFSPTWLQAVLRGQLGFTGAIISDDLSMVAAQVAGAAVERALAALDAGCDALLICNDRPATVAMVEALGAASARPVSASRLIGLRARDTGAGPAEIARRARALAAIERLAA